MELQTARFIPCFKWQTVFLSPTSTKLNVKSARAFTNSFFFIGSRRNFYTILLLASKIWWALNLFYESSLCKNTIFFLWPVFWAPNCLCHFYSDNDSFWCSCVWSAREAVWSLLYTRSLYSLKLEKNQNKYLSIVRLSDTSSGLFVAAPENPILHFNLSKK